VFLESTSWVRQLIQFVQQHQPQPTRLVDLAEAQPVLGRPPGLPPLGPFLGIPLTAAGRARGALYLARPVGQPPFDAAEEESAVSICAWLEQGDLFEEARLLAQLRLLNQVAQAAAGNLDLSRILSVALRELDRRLPLHVCAVWILADNACPAGEPGVRGSAPLAAPRANTSLVLADSSAIPSEQVTTLGLVPGLRLTLEQTPFAPCLNDGQALYADPRCPEEQASPLLESLAARGATCCFAVPLRSGDRSVGILQCVATRPAGFTAEQIQLLYLVADLLGPAVSNCQFFSRLHSAYEELRRTQDQLIQAEKMRALGELAGGMAHDFNNSLCGALGFLELALLDKALPPSCQGYLESARVCALDAAQTVRRVQDFARWRRNELSVHLLDVNELARQTVELTRPKWESLGHARGRPIREDVVTEATAWVCGSSSELREVLTNLVFNAVDAMPKGGELIVRTWSTATDVFLSVRDTGVGMSAAVRQRLFEPFFTTKGERGNGMGLSVAFGIVQRFGGEILVETEVGRGSTFTVRLPVATNQPAPKPPAAEASAVGTATKSLRVLVVEDEETIRRFLAAGLTQLGHRPRITPDARQGLAALAEERFDVVLTDLGLPGMSGEEVARTVALRCPQTPVVLLTGWSEQLKAEAVRMEGVTQILGKPVTLATLAATLAAVSRG
jgi:signal transduction histidine kinase